MRPVTGPVPHSDGERSLLPLSHQRPIQCWCPTCGMVRTDYEPLPFCRHNIPSCKPYPSTRMVSLPMWHPLAGSVAA